MGPQHIIEYDPGELLARTREYVERAIAVDPGAGFSLADIATDEEWRVTLSSVIGPAVVAEAVAGAVSALVPLGLPGLQALAEPFARRPPAASTVTMDDLRLAHAWLQVDVGRRHGLDVDRSPAAVVDDVLSAGAHRDPTHLSALILAVVLVADGIYHQVEG